MPNYLFNEVELPALPEWDKTTYPYAYIRWNGVMGIYGKKYAIVVSAVPLSFISGTQWGSNDTVAFATSEIDTSASNEWSAFAYKQSTIKYEVGVALPIWCNTDILKTDGSVFLPASEPVPVGGEPEPEPSAEPYPYPDDPLAIAYIYGEHGIGPLLPLTSTIRENYPYAMIFNGYLIFTDNPIVVIPPRWYSLYWELCTQENLTTKYINYFQETNVAGDPYFEKWGLGTAEGVTWTKWWHAAPQANVLGGLTGQTLVIWANYTVYDIGGGVVCEPSMPIPVYADTELPDPEPEEVPFVSIYAQNPADWETQGFYEYVDGQKVYRDIYVRVNGKWLLAIIDESEENTPVPDPTPAATYLYGGVELPDINEAWTDKETFPYAAIYPYGEKSRVYFSDAPFVYKIYDLTGEQVLCTGGKTINKYSAVIEDNAFVSVGHVETLGTDAMIVGAGDLELCWANYDVYDINGNLKLAASEPVPV